MNSENQQNLHSFQPFLALTGSTSRGLRRLCAASFWLCVIAASPTPANDARSGIWVCTDPETGAKTYTGKPRKSTDRSSNSSAFPIAWWGRPLSVGKQVLKASCFAEVRLGIWFLASLKYSSNHVSASGFGETSEFVERVFGEGIVRRN